MQQAAQRSSQPLDYATLTRRWSARQLSIAVAVIHLLTSIMVTWLWMQQTHAHMLHADIPLNPFEQAIRVLAPVLYFPVVDLWGWCVGRLPDLGQAVYIAAIVLAFALNSLVWAVVSFGIVRIMRGRSGAA
jgi:hypothetical protein